LISIELYCCATTRKQFSHPQQNYRAAAKSLATTKQTYGLAWHDAAWQETDHGRAYCHLDGPLLLRQDHEQPLIHDAVGVYPAKPQLWG
jgi:hypothetical protein